MKQNDSKRLKAGSPAKLRALAAMLAINPALKTFVPTNSDLHIDNAAIGDHNSTAPAPPDR